MSVYLRKRNVRVIKNIYKILKYKYKIQNSRCSTNSDYRVLVGWFGVCKTRWMRAVGGGANGTRMKNLDFKSLIRKS